MGNKSVDVVYFRNKPDAAAGVRRLADLNTVLIRNPGVSCAVNHQDGIRDIPNRFLRDKSIDIDSVQPVCQTFGRRDKHRGEPAWDYGRTGRFPGDQVRRAGVGDLTPPNSITRK